jgi:hypothetical protein
MVTLWIGAAAGFLFALCGAVAGWLEPPKISKRIAWTAFFVFLAGGVACSVLAAVPSNPTAAGTTGVVESPRGAPTRPGAASSSANGAGTPQASYAQLYGNFQFSMPGYDCVQNYPSGVDFSATKPIVTSAPFGPIYGTVYVDCTGSPPSIGFSNPNGEGYHVQAALISSGTPDAAACQRDVTKRPVSGEINYYQLHAGVDLCVAIQQIDSDLIVLLHLTSLNETSTYDLSWTATAWMISATS